MAIGSESPSGHRAPRYSGEDTTPTTQREVRGWYAYGIAAEVFAVCGVGMSLCFVFYISFASANYWVCLGSFLPLTLEQLARERGMLQLSHLPCVGPDSPQSGNETAPTLRRAEGEEQCLVGVLGLQINTASFAMYTFSLAVLVQALTLISFSALADYGRYIASGQLNCTRR